VRVNLGDVVILVVLFIVIGILYGFAAALVLLPVGLISFIPGICASSAVPAQSA
jgi:hypothetical protein